MRVGRHTILSRAICLIKPKIRFFTERGLCFFGGIVIGLVVMQFDILIGSLIVVSGIVLAITANGDCED
jgi:hypothetical protein